MTENTAYPMYYMLVGEYGLVQTKKNTIQKKKKKKR